MLYGHELNLPMDITAGVPVDQPMTSISAYWNELVQQLQQAHSIVWACQVIKVMSWLVLCVQHINSPSQQHTIHVQHVKPCIGDEMLAQLHSNPEESDTDDQLKINAITNNCIMDG
jgi:hypothetical protein